ncbi:hypothetical protein FALBO_10351 [Fusarium albosuccineum]|uniref:DUF1772-domain-containing protein n=1 Tax=Fusarium albosuccineum TaxID=1237068 RepID=A0A8H4L7Y5_9HYPO|nr:hypothetical protein FALBO_10351 [Fusarium albosuccineum]
MDSIIRTTQVFGLTSSIFLGGVNIGASHLTVPLLYTRPISISTPLFNELYLRGAVSLVPLGILSGTASALVAYLVPSQRTLWAAAAAATLAQTPWTLLVMMSTNNRLNAIASSSHEQEKISQEEVVGLLKRWWWMNIVRGLLALGGGLTAVWAVMSEPTVTLK